MKKLAAVLVLAVAVSAQAAKMTHVVGQEFPAVDTVDLLSGAKVNLKDTLAKKEVQGVVVFFTSYTCPVALAYEERINELAEKHKGKVPFIALNANANENGDQQTTHAKEKGLKFAVGIDKGSDAAKKIGASATPEFYLIGKDGKVVYHGPLDDSQDPQHIDKKLLASAIENHLAGKEIPADDREVQAFGCGIKFPK
ncbi:MAG: redoxin family protein [Candidatus Omnitrophica bacterium]|nr:redoxin family protein [Candidatus Omnitrophota bacterium]